MVRLYLYAPEAAIPTRVHHPHCVHPSQNAAVENACFFTLYTSLFSSLVLYTPVLLRPFPVSLVLFVLIDLDLALTQGKMKKYMRKKQRKIQRTNQKKERKKERR